jgi:CPA1 family monovalent cation:H+ antiporter
VDLAHASDGPHAYVPACAHAPDQLASASGDRCEECGSTFNLRLCAQCGHVGCCESQAGDARAHALRQGHPVILQIPAGRGFTWCYAENRYL